MSFFVVLGGIWVGRWFGVWGLGLGVLGGLGVWGVGIQGLGFWATAGSFGVRYSPFGDLLSRGVDDPFCLKKGDDYLEVHG